MKKLLAAFFFSLLLLSTKQRSAHAENIDSLCASGIEGTYVGKFEGRPFYYNLFCVGDGRLLAMFGDASADVSLIMNLVIANIDGDNLIVSNFKLDPKDRRDISSKSRLTYLRLKLNALKQGKLEGVYHNGSLNHFVKISASKQAAFPRFNCDAAAKITSDGLVGVFDFKLSSNERGTLVSDVLAGAPVITLAIGGEGLQMMDGLPWDGSGCFTSFTAQGDGEPDARPLFAARGKLTGPGTIEFFWFNYQGIHGPAKAIKNPNGPSLQLLKRLR